MKKIKGLLLFGILTLLGIGSSFGTSIQSFGIMKDVGTDQFNGILGIQNQGSNPYMYVLSGLNSLPFTFNSHSAGVGNVNPTSSIFDYGINGFRFRGSSTDSGNVYFDNGFDSLVFSNSSSPSCLLYDSVNGGYFAATFLNIDGTYQRVLIHNGEVILSFPSSYTSRCIYGVGNSLSIMFGSSSTGDLNFYNIFTDSGGIVHIDTGYAVVPIYSSGNDLSGSGVLVISSDFPTSNLVFNYYDVFSSNPDEIRQGNLINKGYSYSSLSSYDFFYGNFLAYSNTSYSSITKGFYPFFCLLPNGEDLKCFSHLNYVYSNNNYYLPTSNIIFPTYNQGVYSLTSDSSAPVIDLSSEGGQSSGSMAINTGLINLCLTSPSFYELNTIFCNRVFGGRDLSYVQGLISSGAYLQSYVDGSGNLVYVVDITDEPGVLTGVVTWECYGDRCINTESGSWGDVEPWEILHLSGGDILSSGYYLGFFESINETGYFFKCPYSYNNSRWIAGKSILNAIGRDPFLPINCFIAAYENGRRVKLFDEAFNGYSWGPLMNGDTQNHNNLFTFFDVLLSVSLIFFLMKFYHLFK